MYYLNRTILLKCIKLLFFIWFCFFDFGKLGVASVGPTQWLKLLIEDAKSRRYTMQEIKKCFAIRHVAQRAYGDRLKSLDGRLQEEYFSLIDTFFEKAVIQALFQPSSTHPKVSYKMYPVQKPSRSSECAISIVGAISHEQRVDWHVSQRGEEPETYETRFCIRPHGTSFEIVDVVLEGISWVADLSEEVNRFYTEELKKNSQKSPVAIHNNLLQKLRTQISKLKEST